MSNNTRNVSVKPETRNHKGFFIQDVEYQLMGVDESGWALICLDDVSCHYVDPDNLEALEDLVE
ncbi:hypothetical protein [Baaleninema simplex]|uniref:hypothetical protein n=1 Tax=Baaleninema simplex TaxID=2862350 RepID=UPI0008FC09A5|nr:hypothetical protein [Baaleninema simplex]